MRTLKLLWILALLIAAAVAAPTLTVVTQRIDRADGHVAKGTVAISWQSFDTALGEHVQAGSKTVSLLPTGFLTVSLAPNVGASPSTTRYTVVYHLDLGTPQTAYWIVPTSGPVTVTAIQSTTLVGPSSIISLGQLNTSGATVNQCMVFNGTVWGPDSCSNAAQSVSSVFGRIGAVVAVSGDYTAAQVTNAVSKIAANTYSGGGLQDFSAMKFKPALSTVAALPAASANASVVYEVTDAVSQIDCTVGLSTSRALCVSDGTNWIPVAPTSATNFSALAPGTNNLGTFNVGSGSTWTYTGGGIINANKILGTTLTSLTGLIKMTAGIPSVAVAANVVSLFAGTPSGAKFLRDDGTIALPPVLSVFGRTGAVVQVSGDYNASQVTNAVDSTSTYSDPAWLTALLSTKLTFTALGDLVYGGPAGAGTRLAGNTTSTKKFLRQTGTGSVSAAPAWDTIVAGDIPTLNQNTNGNAATATALAGNGTNCSAGSPPLGVDASGNAESCTALTAAQVTNAVSKIAANAYTTGFQDFTLATHFAPINGVVASKPVFKAADLP